MSYDPQAIEPDHYAGDLILQTASFFDLTMAFGNALKYICRAGRKEGNPFKQDIAKALFYLEWAKAHELGREYMWTSEEAKIKYVVKYLRRLIAAYDLDPIRSVVVAHILLAIDAGIDAYDDYLLVPINLLKEMMMSEP